MDLIHERDEWLMAQVVRGERDGLERLVRRYASPLLTYIRRMVGDRDHSEELFQEVFLAVWAKRSLYRFPRPFKAWLFAIAINKCHEAWRSRSKLPLTREETGELAVAADPSPEASAIATENAVLVANALGQLPPMQRSVVALRIWQGLSYAEIAGILDRTEDTVRSHMHHGLAGLRKYLEPRLAQK